MDGPGRIVFLAGIAAIALVASGCLAVDEPPSFQKGNILGLRCGVSSTFLEDEYDLTPGRGCVILRVSDSGGAQQSGMRIGDRIVEMDAIPITSGRQFTFLLPTMPRKDVHEFVLERGEERLTLDVEFGASAFWPEQDPYFYYLRAKSNEGDYGAAIEDYTRAIELEPTFDLAYLYRGDARIRLASMFGDGIREAVADFEKALELDPHLAEAHRNLAFIRMFIEEDAERALALVERSLQIDECSTPIAFWSVDCAETLIERSEIYLGRLSPGDADLIEADMDAIAAVSVLEPSIAKLRWEVSYLRGDDPSARAAGEYFVSLPLKAPNEHHDQRQTYIARVLNAPTATLEYALGWFFVQGLGAPKETIYGTQPWLQLTPGEDSSFSWSGPPPGESLMAFQIDAPGLESGSQVSWELLLNDYRIASGEETNPHGEQFQIHFGARRRVPYETYELRVYANDRMIGNESLSLQTLAVP